MIEWFNWSMRAIDIIQKYEGNDPWANIAGNFDGCYLTCGALGFTWKYNNQPPMILEFIKRHGEEALLQLMPLYGKIYIKAAQLGENQGAGIVSSWTLGDEIDQKVGRELSEFWKSDGMIQIQVETAQKMMGGFAQKKCIEGQHYFKLKDPKFSHYVYWFDQAVLNGTGKTVQFEENNLVTFEEIIDWGIRAIGYATASLLKNTEVWREIYDKQTEDRQALFRMAYLRAKKSRTEFMPVTMNRRGTLALGEGFVNGGRVSYPWRIK